MPCRYLSKVVPARCLASDRVVVPSLLEKLVLCYGDHQECPILQSKERILKKAMHQSKSFVSQDFRKEANAR